MTLTGSDADQYRRPAVLLDRDGTLTEHRHYPAYPDELLLQPDVGAPLRALQEEGFALVVVTNQSGVARGLFGATALEAMHDRLRVLLDRQGVRLDAIYACPHHPEGTVPRYRFVCRCRKPAPGMLLQAARDLDLDLTRSWMVGDSPCDVEAGHRAGTRTARVGVGLDGRADADVTGATTSEVLRHVVGYNVVLRGDVDISH
ncbi:D-glycero-alpha-D-manno-heptose-1,7-bisphosphate 7-phosphatase [Streptomyces sp. NPDC056194]|uniref:D-glycero-alpha-D-manno-heptose-1,7-bisphosphate 7-phosphatase n=1 Tax=unclassified Streptomyces TaxID=2593676 RepID=UPI0035D952BA